MDSGSQISHFTTCREEEVVIPISSKFIELSSEISYANPIQSLIEDMEPNELVDEIPLRKSQRVHRPTISNDYMICLQEHEFNVFEETNPITFTEAMSSANSLDELASIQNNQVWNLVELSANSRPVGCKWVFKTKRDAQGQIERYKARLVAKDYTQ